MVKLISGLVTLLTWVFIMRLGIPFFTEAKEYLWLILEFVVAMIGFGFFLDYVG